MIVLALTLFAIFFLFLVKQSDVEESFTKDFNLAVIETTGQENKSCLTFYNNDFEKIGTQKIELGSMGSPYDLPKVYDKYMSVVPQGMANSKELTIVMEYNMETGKYEKYDMNQHAMNSAVANDKSIYSVNTINYNTIISWYDKSSGNLKTISREAIYISNIYLYDDTLYAFGLIKEASGTKSYLYLIDTKSFTITDTIDISTSGVNQYSATKIGDYLYFANQDAISDNNDQGSYNLSKFNIKDKTISNIKLNEQYPFQIINYKDKLLISHYTLSQLQGNIITIYDPKTNEQLNVTLENNLEQILIKDDMLYSMDGEFLYVYSINNTEFNLIKKVDIHTKKDSSTFYYIAGMFTK
jgi:hypothetical protein